MGRIFLQPQLTRCHGNIWAAMLTMKLVKKSTLAWGNDSEWNIILTMEDLALSKAYVKLSLETGRKYG
jgi:hypothetical protein